MINNNQNGTLATKRIDIYWNDSMLFIIVLPIKLRSWWLNKGNEIWTHTTTVKVLGAAITPYPYTAPTGFEPVNVAVKVLCLSAWRRGFIVLIYSHLPKQPPIRCPHYSNLSSTLSIYLSFQIVDNACKLSLTHYKNLCLWGVDIVNKVNLSELE